MMTTFSDNHIFNPVQPEMLSNCHMYLEYKPQRTINTEVALFYQFNIDNLSQGNLPIIPDGCLDLLFCCDESHPYAILATSPEIRCSYHFQPHCEYFGVRLYPNQTVLKFQCSIKELIQQQQIPLFDILKIDSYILEEISYLSSFKDRITYFKDLLEKKSCAEHYDQNLLKYCLYHIYSTPGIVNMKQLTEKTGYSDRYIRKKFETYIGFAPKQFSQIVRFQHSVQELLTKQQHVEELIDHYGFFDEAHFYKGFKKFTTLTPKQYKEMYHTSKRIG